MKMSKEEYNKWYDSLWETVEPLKEYYDIDKVKAYSVYVWAKTDDWDEEANLFDIYADKIVMYDEEHQIIEEAKPIIKKIQEKLKEFNNL